MMFNVISHLKDLNRSFICIYSDLHVITQVLFKFPNNFKLHFILLYITQVT